MFNRELEESQNSNKLKERVTLVKENSKYAIQNVGNIYSDKEKNMLNLA